MRHEAGLYDMAALNYAAHCRYLGTFENRTRHDSKEALLGSHTVRNLLDVLYKVRKVLHTLVRSGPRSFGQNFLSLKWEVVQVQPDGRENWHVALS
jgi:hypothetical protein